MYFKQTKAPQPGAPGKGYFLSSLTGDEAHPMSVIWAEKKTPENWPSNPAPGQLQQPHIPVPVLLSRAEHCQANRGRKSINNNKNPLQITLSVTPVQLNTCRRALAVLSDSGERYQWTTGVPHKQICSWSTTPVFSLHSLTLAASSLRSHPLMKNYLVEII